MTESPQAAPTDDSPLGLPVAEVEHLLATMAKSLRAFNMYQANNPVFQRFQEALRDAFDQVWEETGSVELILTEEGFKYGDRVIAVGSGRESLAFQFYKDGVRHLTFLPGFEDEVGEFLDAVNRAMRRDHDADDLITVLWEKDFASLQYGYVDLLTEGLSPPDEPKEGAPPPLDLGGFDLVGEAVAAEEGGEAAGKTGALKAGITREDFDETLYFLDQSEMAALQTEVQIEMERDLRQDVLNALFDRLEEPSRERQEEILDILDQLLPLFLSRGDMAHGSVILEELDRLTRAEKTPIAPEVQERVERVFARLSDPEVLEQFAQALEDGAVAPDSEDVNVFFSRLSQEAMPVLMRFAAMSQTSGVRGRLASAVDGLATRYPGQVNALLESDEPVLVTGAAGVAGRLGMAQAVPGLRAALEHPDRDVRMAAVEALVSIRLTPALQALIVALDDEDRDVRIAAANALGAIRFASARDALADVIEGKALKDADLTEKMAFYEAYGAVGGTAAVEKLEDILTHKGMLGRRNPTELRACAALGLGRAATPAARTILERARSDDDPIVRNAILQALKQEEGA